MSHFFSIAACFTALAPAAVFAGLVPRLGPGRAVALALRSFRPQRFFPRPGASQRLDELHALHVMLSTLHRDQYIIVSGPKGVGKTSIIETSLQRTFGVVFVRVAVGTAEEKIKADVFTAISRFYLRTLDQTGSARRVLWWHHFLFRTPVTVVLQAAERKATQQFADLDSAARALTQDFGVRVLIDASSNSLPDAAFATKREVLLDVQPMPRALIEQLPELEPLHKALKDADLADIVWACVGGNPADYKALWGAWKRSSCKDIDLVAAAFVQDLLGKALSAKSLSIAADERLRGLYLLFRERSEVPESVLEEMKIVRPSPADKVLRAVKQRTAAGSDGNGRRILVPADAATTLVLKLGLTDTPSMQHLKAMLRT